MNVFKHSYNFHNLNVYDIITTMENKYKKLFIKIQILLISAALAIPSLSFADNLRTFLVGQIAVEKTTRQGGANEFSGLVGSLRFDIEGKAVYIAEFFKLNKNITVINGIFKITKLEQSADIIAFECIDQSFLTKGAEWTGKIWLAGTDDVKIEMNQKQSSRQWVNLGGRGKKFLEENGLKHLFLGI